MQVFCEQCESGVPSMGGGELIAQVYDVIAKDAFYARVEGIVQPDDGGGLHAPVQIKRHAAASNKAGFIFQKKLRRAVFPFFEQVNSKPIFKVNLAGLVMNPFAKAGATVIGMAFKVHAVV